MILVEVYAPALGCSYDFELDQNATLRVLTEEIIEMLCRREKRAMPAQTELFSLGDMDGGTLLSRDGTLRAYGIGQGGQLLLI
ncbi:hypothetical protein OBV_34280 [Oscillibacter valericigenes Sjm18-20]|nr:hypothetical protein OBV_34280 [Oscillibacter valericigenes Sjm18-20]